MKSNSLFDLAGSIGQAVTGHETAAIIVAAGNSTRMGGKISKQFRLVNGKPVLAHTLIAYQNCPLIREIVVVARPEDFEKVYDLRKKYGILKMTAITAGGETRQASVRKGLLKLADRFQYIAIADGARCLVTPGMIAKVCAAAYQTNAACAGHRLTDTVKRSTPTGLVTETLDRNGLWQVQTPQIFHTALYYAAAMRAEREKFNATDDAALVEHIGYTVQMVECGRENFKITTPNDLPLASVLLKLREAKKK